MRKYVLIITALFVLHVIEEIFFSFWNTDPFTLFFSNTLDVPAITVYVIIQLTGALFLVFILLSKDSRTLHFILGLILLFELTHVVAAISSHGYTPGLYTGIILGCASVPFFTKILRFNSSSI